MKSRAAYNYNQFWNVVKELYDGGPKAPKLHPVKRGQGYAFTFVGDNLRAPVSAGPLLMQQMKRHATAKKRSGWEFAAAHEWGHSVNDLESEGNANHIANQALRLLKKAHLDRQWRPIK